MSMERTKVLLRPSLRFIATLPTLKLKEEIRSNIIVWEVEMDEPVMLLCRSYPILHRFLVVSETLEDFTPTGRVYDLRIGIYKNLPNCLINTLIEPVDEDFYLNHKWWSRIVTVGQGV